MRVSRTPSTRLLRLALVVSLAAAASVHLAAPAIAAPALVWQRVIPGAVAQSSPAPVVLPDRTGGLVGGAPDGELYTLKARAATDNPGWPYLALDSTFSSGALADLNGDGQTDLVVGGDSSPGPQGTHPRGGILRALTGNGSVLWEYRIDEQVISSPSIGDIDGDGRP